MLSSWQISAMHAQQGQAFASQQQYSQQLSAQMPSPYNSGLGMTGVGGGGFGQGPGAGYNYGATPSGTGYGTGNMLGNAATSMIGGVGHAFSGGLGMAGALGGAGLGYKMGGVGGAIMGGLGGGMIGGALGMAGKHFFGTMATGAHEQASMERTLSQFQFTNANSMTGKGFSRGDSMQIGNMVRQMERLPELLTSFGELNRLMDKMGQMGIMQGARDAGEFMNKFRTTVTTLRDMAKMMGTTMEGALKAFGEARQSGFYSNSDISTNVIRRQVMGGLTGMNQEQVGALQGFGAQIGHATGGSRRSGAMHISRTATQLGAMNQMGILSNDQIMEMTGKEGAEGIQDLSASMAETSYRMSRSNIGTAMTLALGQTDKSGRFTGKMDEELVARLRRGDIGLAELKSMARGKVQTRGAKLSFKAHEGRLRSEMASSTGIEGQSMMIKEILGDRGWENPDAVNMVQQRFGLSEEQANLMQKMLPNIQNIQSNVENQTRNQAKQTARDAALKDYSWDAMKERFAKKIRHHTTDWIKDIGVSTRSYFQDLGDAFVEEITGQYREHVTKKLSDTLKFAAGGGSATKGLLEQTGISGREAMSRMGIAGRGARMDVGGGGGLNRFGALGDIAKFGASILHGFSGMETSGQVTADYFKGIGGGQHLSYGNADELSKSGATVLDRSGGKAVAMRDIGKASSAADKLTQMTSQDFENLGAKKEIFREAYREAVKSADVLGEKNQAKRSMLIWDKMRGVIGRKARNTGTKITGAIEDSSRQQEIIAAVQAEEARGGNVYAGAVDFASANRSAILGLDAYNQSEIDVKLKELDQSLGKTATNKDTEMGWAEIKKMVDEGDPLAALLLGTNKVGGALTANKSQDDLNRMLNRIGGGSSLEEASGNKLRDLIHRAGAWKPEDKEYIKNTLGVDPEKLEARVNEAKAKDPKFLERLEGARGKLSAYDIELYAGLTAQSGRNKVVKDIKSEGRSLKDKLTDSKSGLAAALTGSGELSQKLTEYASQKADLEDTGLNEYISGGGSYTRADDIAKLLEGKGVSEKVRSQVTGSDESISRAYGTRKDLRKGLKKGMTRDQVMEKLLGTGWEKSDSMKGEVGQKFLKDVEDMLGGKDGKLDTDKEMENVISKGAAMASITTGAGTTGQSKQMSEEEVAQSLTKFAANTASLAQIVKDMGGKAKDSPATA